MEPASGQNGSVGRRLLYFQFHALIPAEVFLNYGQDIRFNFFHHEIATPLRKIFFRRRRVTTVIVFFVFPAHGTIRYRIVISKGCPAAAYQN